MKDYIVLDIETTGISAEYSALTEIGAAKVIDDKVVMTYSQLINPNTEIPQQIIDLTGITNEMVKNEPTIEEVLPEFMAFCGDLPILGHNIIFDFSFLKTSAMRISRSFEKKALDTLELARHFVKEQPSYSLTNLVKRYQIEHNHAHRGYDDALATHKLYQILKNDYYTSSTEHYFIPKPLCWKPKKQSSITPKQKSFLNSLIKNNCVEINYDVNELSKSEASRKIDKILTTYGRKT